MDKALLRPLIFEVLRRTPQTHLHAIENEIRQKTVGYERGDALLVQEAVWELLLQGVLAPGKNSLNLHLPFVHVTEYGQRCLDDGAIVAHDPDGYVVRLRAETDNAVSDEVVECARDALLAFHRGLFRASLVLLSRAAARVFAEIHAATRDGDGSTTDRRSHVAADEAELGLPELAALVRLAHSETGVPAIPSANRESALGRILLFPEQCRQAYMLIARRRERVPTVGV